ncbi:hypothetical protein BaRGS_00012214 [Batillaria attramentaria]|uniref:Sodium/glucose cotransporter 4 n=1 Tax=Batillaria attramentaria TaxID=370345 RepID=A0ABD0LAK9_9CAEN
MVEELATGDYIAIAVYFALVLAVGLWTPNRDSATGYFLAGKDMHWIPVGASIFASNVGAPMFIGLAGTAAASGMAVAIYEWHAVFLLIGLGWVFLPVYVASGAFTMPEYLKKRFGGKRLRIYMSFLALFLYVLTKISAEIYSGAIFMQQLLGWNLYLCVIVILAVTAIYTAVGGLAAVIYTRHAADYSSPDCCLHSHGVLWRWGGWEAMMEKYKVAAANYTLADPANYSCGLPRDDYMHIWRDPVTGDIPWTGAVFGLTTLGLWVWCADQLMIGGTDVRTRSQEHDSRQGGLCVGGSLKVLSFFLFILPGMMSRVLFPDDIACADPDLCDEICGNRAGCTNIAYPLLVLRKMPIGLRGVMLAALLAALMSSLTSIFNSASSMFTMDIWRRFRRRASQHELMIVGRACVLVEVGISILWLPILQAAQSGQLWSYLQAVSSYTAPPWCCIFLMAIFWTRTTEAGAFWGLMISLVVGLIRMIMDFALPAPFCGSKEEDPRPDVLKKVNFLHFAIILSGVSVISTVVISLLTEPRPPEKLRRVTWWTRHDPLDPEETESEDDFAQDEEEKEPEIRKKTIGRKLYNWACGIDDKPKPKLTPEQKAAIKRKMTSLHEHPAASRLTTAGAITIACITTFLLGFFY